MNSLPPYRFDRLQKEFRSAGINIKNPSEEGVSTADVVEITGTVEPMALFRIELYDDAMGSFGDAFEEAAGIVEGSPDVDSGSLKEIEETGEKAKGNQATASMAKGLYLNRVHIRLDDGDQSYAIPLRRESRRTPFSHAFSTPRKYTIFGRIEERISSKESWVPGDTFRILQNLSEDQPANKFDKAIIEIAEGRDIKMKSRHMEVKGPAKITHPIAIWW